VRRALLRGGAAARGLGREKVCTTCAELPLLQLRLPKTVVHGQGFRSDARMRELRAAKLAAKLADAAAAEKQRTKSSGQKARTRRRIRSSGCASRTRRCGPARRPRAPLLTT